MAMTASNGWLGMVTAATGAGVPVREGALGGEKDPPKFKPPSRSVTLDAAWT